MRMIGAERRLNGRRQRRAVTREAQTLRDDRFQVTNAIVRAGVELEVRRAAGAMGWKRKRLENWGGSLAG